MPYRQAKSQFWTISYIDASGKQVRRASGTTDYAEAKALEQKLRAEGFEARKKAGGVSASFQRVLLEYVTKKESLDPTTKSRCKLLLAHFRDKALPDITRQDVINYAAKRLTTVSQSTVNREIAILSAAIAEFNRRHGCDIPNPASKMKKREPEGRVRWITKAEARYLIACASPQVADFITLGLMTGMRNGEMMELTWDRVDRQRGLILLEAQHTKTERRRTIPIHEKAEETLARCRTRWPQSPYVFGGYGSFKKGFAGACARAGITNFHIHDLRHTFASWLVMAGVNLYEVKDLLGHSSIELTQRYAHLAPENLRRAVGTLSV